MRESPEEFLDRVCRRKLAFRSAAKAKHFITREMKYAKRNRLYVYQCPHCGQWHTTKLEQRDG